MTTTIPRSSATDGDSAVPVPPAGPARRRRPSTLVLVALAIVVVLVAVFAVRAAAAALAPSVALPAGGVDDGSAAVHYSGTWSQGNPGGYLRKSDHVSAATGATAVLRFTGSQIAVYGGVAPSDGIARVSVDGGPAYEVDFYGATTKGARLLWVSAPLTGGAHRLTLRVTGERRDVATGASVDLDGFRVVRQGVTRTASARGAGLTFSSGWTTAANGSRTTANGAVALRFTGRAAILAGAATGASGTASIDGGAAQPLVGGTGDLWASGPLKPGAHTVVVRLHGGTATLTSATVVRTLAAVPVPTAAVRTSRGWRTYAVNPVVGKNWGTAFDLAAMYQGGLYRVWFSWRPKAAIAYVQSVDGISWTAPRIVLAARPGTWEADVNRPTVLLAPGGGYRMWYTGQDAGASAIGAASSPDGIHWTRDSTTPVLTAQGWEQPSVMNASVLYDSTTHRYRMWFSGGQTEEPNSIGYATSADGLTWTRFSTGPIFSADPAHRWEQNRVAGIQVVQQAPKSYLAFYIGYRDILTAAIGVSRSTDGIHWTHDLTKPLIAAVPKTWDCDAVYKPYALWDATNDEWRLWFNGRCGGDEQLGMAVHKGAALF